MGIPKLPTFGGIKVEISPKMSTDDQLDGAGRTGRKRDSNVRGAATPSDEKNLDPRPLKKEHDEKILNDAKRLKIGEDGHAAEVRTLADQQAKIIRQTLEKQLKGSGK